MHHSSYHTTTTRMTYKVNVSIAEVTRELVRVRVRSHDTNFHEEDEKKDLEKSSLGHSFQGLEAVGNGSKGGSIGGNVSGKSDTGLLGQETNNSKHGNTSVLQFNVSETIELFLVRVFHKSKGIEESEGSLGTDFALETGAQGGRGLLLGNRGESSSAGDKGGKDGSLHGCFLRLGVKRSCASLKAATRVSWAGCRVTDLSTSIATGTMTE